MATDFAAIIVKIKATIARHNEKYNRKYQELVKRGVSDSVLRDIERILREEDAIRKHATEELAKIEPCAAKTGRGEPLSDDDVASIGRFAEESNLIWEIMRGLDSEFKSVLQVVNTI